MALPYANGPLHLGHLLEAIQTDIWVRWQKLLGNSCYFISGNDAHGTPIMLSAEKKGIAVEQMLAEIHAEHQRDFAAFEIDFDKFYSTHTPENEKLSRDIFTHIQARGDIITQEIEQAFDAEKNIFLPDRYVKGTCPRCGSPEQNGDSCEVCGATYTPADLRDAYSILSGTKPIYKKSLHYFFRLENYRDLLSHWIESNSLQTEVANKLKEWVNHDLRDWDISRDAPYFGFLIPGEKDKYFYVWVDAPIGYMAGFKKFCDDSKQDIFDKFWRSEETQLYHFIGKDIAYFHGLFWPAFLKAADYRLPSAIYVHGFLTVNGQKMSKSRGTFITAQQYLADFPAEYLRYYFAAKLSDTVEDIDLNWQDFAQRINSDLIGKVVNIASRSASFIHNYFSGKLADQLADKDLFMQFVDAGEEISNDYINRRYSAAIRRIMGLSDMANQYIAEKKPWELIKQGKETEVHEICTEALNLFKLIVFYLKPVMPILAKNAEDFLQIEPVNYFNRDHMLLNQEIKAYQALANRIDLKQMPVYATVA